MSIEHSQNLACFCNVSSHSFTEGPSVRKILVVGSGPEGPQFSRSVGTLMYKHENYFELMHINRMKVTFNQFLSA